MNDQQKLEKLNGIFADKAFTEKVLAMDSIEEVQKALAEKGAELSVKEIEDVRQGLVNHFNGGEELDAGQLKNVAGGFVITAAVVGAIATCVSATAAAGGFVHTVTERRW